MEDRMTQLLRGTLHGWEDLKGLVLRPTRPTKALAPQTMSSGEKQKP